MVGPAKELSRIESVYDAIEERFGEDLERCRDFLRLKSVSATGEGIAETAHRVQQFIQDAPQYDDITLVAMGRD